MPLDGLYSGPQTPSATGMWQRAYVLDRLTADDLDGIQALVNATGGGQDYDYDFNTESWPPSYVAWRAGDEYEVALQGTSNARQVLLHVGGTIDTGSAPHTAFVNKSWGTQAASLIDRFIRYIEGKPAPSLITIAGHSYGAGVAGIIASRVADRFGDGIIRLVTYGSPRWGSGVGFSGMVSQEVRVVNLGDVIQRIPQQALVIDAVGAAKQILFKQSLNVLWRHRGQRVSVDKNSVIAVGGNDEEEPYGLVSFEANDWYQAHVISSYRGRLSRSSAVSFPSGWTNGQPGPQTPSGTQQVLVSPAVPTDNVDVPNMNRVYYGTVSGPITLENRESFQSSSLAVGEPRLRFSADIGGGRSSVAAFSSFTRISLVINNGKNGHAESHVVNVSAEDRGAMGQIVGLLLNARTPLLGNGQTTAPFIKAPQSPKVEYVRITDAVNPKLGYIFNYEKAQTFGPASLAINSPATSAEAMMKAITVRLTGTNAAGTGSQKNTTCQIISAPDGCMIGYDYIPGFIMGNAQPFGLALGAYIDTLCNGGGTTGLPTQTFKFGFMGVTAAVNVSPPTTAMTIKSVTRTIDPDPQNYIFTTVAANGFLNGDRVRIRGSNNVFNGVWQVEPITATTFQLKNPPVSGHSLPRGGFVYSLQSGGRATTGFFQYQPRPSAFPTDNYGNVVCAISKHDAGRQWFPTLGRSRVRREK